jgi:hypothetical protein
MKAITFFPLSPYPFKVAGAVLALAGLILNLTVNPHFELLLFTGLLLMVFSKERNESEAVKAVRAELFKSVFGYTLSLTIALHLTGLISEGFSADLPPMYYIGFPLLLYLMLFYGILALKLNVDSNLDMLENAKDHRPLFITWAFLALAISIILIVRYLYIV